MNLLMISGDRSVLQGKKGAFWYTLDELRKYWERIDVITPAAEERRAESGELFANVFFHPSPHGLWYQSKWIREKGRVLIDQYHHDVMTVHEYPPFYNGCGARKLARRTGVPFALEIHHVVGYPLASSIAESIGAFLSKTVLPWEAKDARMVRTVSAGVKKTLIAFGIPEEKIAVVPSFYLDRDLLKPVTLEKKYSVVTSARLVMNKGIPELIDAIALVPDAALLIAGDGPDRHRLERHARRCGLGHRVTFAGWLPDQQSVIAAVQSAHIFVMNSRSEGGPRSALEAMAVGMPVIATRVGVMPEVIHDGFNGVFTSGDAVDVAEKIRLLLGQESLRIQIGREARSILDRFERKMLIREYANFLKMLAADEIAK